MSLASIHTSLPENNAQSNECNAFLDHVKVTQKGEICEGTREVKDIFCIGRFTIRVSLGEVTLAYD